MSHTDAPRDNQQTEVLEDFRALAVTTWSDKAQTPADPEERVAMGSTFTGFKP